uniref:Uncharacterized protein n=1 Tax=Anguilla anguilla TaxID=7936 RepID=A0A0E9WKZ5_ANGAN
MRNVFCHKHLCGQKWCVPALCSKSCNVHLQSILNNRSEEHSRIFFSSKSGLSKIYSGLCWDAGTKCKEKKRQQAISPIVLPQD